VKIIDLARRIIELSGLSVKDDENPDGDIEIQVTGLRPGEKLYEELLIGDNPQPTSHQKIMKADEDFIPWADLERRLVALEAALSINDEEPLRLMLCELVSGYTADEKLVDWIYMEQESDAHGLARVG